MADLTIKRGDTFIYTATWDGATLSELRSQVRNSLGQLTSEVTINNAGTPYTFVLSVVDTSKWPIGVLQTDIQRTVGGLIISSETITINVLRDVTQ
ncbi:hypothetical protein [Paenibacillus wynnii]|uniref:Uncharacterized protein n=1 Tax=Paenibacillus wynnii TaxID=268407 RepID=A0A098MF71_9BACL|nr:hypothetical protein [Paenibacillus wynnii]KGE20688.1 hypothetical protein PWYN_00400 [Paenibacillus wynnii]